MEHSERQELPHVFVRGTMQLDFSVGPPWSSQNQILFHPSVLYPQVQELIIVDPNAVDRVEIVEGVSGCMIRIHNDSVNGSVKIPFPPAAMINTDEWRMWTNKPPLNEFGYLYVALFLAGNYARYFPDRWLFDVETSTPLALAIDELCALAEWRAPWLSLCELDRTLYVLEN